MNSIGRIRLAREEIIKLLISIGAVFVVVCFSFFTINTLLQEHQALRRKLQKNATWSAYRINRQTSELLRAITSFLDGKPEGTLDKIRTQFEIVLSSRDNIKLSNLESPNGNPDAHGHPVQQDEECRAAAAAVYSDLERLDKEFSAPISVDAPDIASIEKLQTAISELYPKTVVLVTQTDLVDAQFRIDERTKSIKTYKIVLFQQGALALGLCAMGYLFLKQLSRAERSQEELRKMNTNYQEAAAKATAGDQAKSVFLATMSHEIRTPLNGILGNVDLLEEPNLSPEQRSLLATIRECGTSLLELIQDILDYSRLESRSLTLETRSFQLSSPIEAAIDIVSSKARQKNLGLLAIYPEGQLLGDEARVRQVLVNLCGNAVKFTETGDVALLVHRIRGESGESWLRFAVRDTGIGISKEAQARLFEDFYQIDASINRRFGGSGLGLAISRRLVLAMGGQIGVTSEEDRGSCFWFTLPIPSEQNVTPVEIPWPTSSVQFCTFTPMAFDILRGEWSTPYPNGDKSDSLLALESSDGCVLIDARKLGEFQLPPELMKRAIIFAFSASRFSNEALAILDGPLTPPRLRSILLNLNRAEPLGEASTKAWNAAGLSGTVLLVEDNIVNQTVASRLLQRLGMTVELASNGELAVARMRKGGIDLVLMDMQMPVMDGMEATRQIRLINNKFRDVPIVGLTANAFAESRDLCLSAGMNDFITKPINREKLESTLKKWRSRLSERPTEILPPRQQKPEGQPKGYTDPLSENGFTRPLREPVISQVRRHMLREELGDKTAVRLTEVFWNDLRGQVLELQKTTNMTDPVATRRIFHTIKGSAETIGFTAIAEASSQTRDTFLKEGRIDLAPLDRAIQETQAELGQDQTALA